MFFYCINIRMGAFMKIKKFFVFRESGVDVEIRANDIFFDVNDVTVRLNKLAFITNGDFRDTVIRERVTKEQFDRSSSRRARKSSSRARTR
jgi:hypothetical protein